MREDSLLCNALVTVELSRLCVLAEMADGLSSLVVSPCCEADILRNRLEAAPENTDERFDAIAAGICCCCCDGVGVASRFSP